MPSPTLNVRNELTAKSTCSECDAFVRTIPSRYGSLRSGPRGKTMAGHWRTIFAGIAVFAAPPFALAAPDFTMAQVRDYPFISELDANQQGGHFAFVRDLQGARNVWVADAPAYMPRPVTQYKSDDGQEITQASFSPDGKILV